MRRPCTITCAPTSVSGFNRTGFMSVCGSAPAASACKACARPISPPLTVTAALFDMFCGLNGNTRSPLRLAMRERPATMSDLPTFEPTPWIINARAIASQKSPWSEFDARLRLDAGAERVLDQRHLGDEVGGIDQFLLGVAPGEHDMRQRRLLVFQEFDDLIDVKIIVAKRDVDLVENDHAQAGIGDQSFGFFPACARRRDIAGAVLRFPGKTFAHRVKPAEIAKMAGQEPPLAGIPCALDELDDRARKAMRHAAQDHAESGG